MSKSAPILKHARRIPLARILWGVLFAAHLPATLALVDGEGGLARFAVLLSSQLFFLLKIIDVRWLRWPTDRRTLLALTAGLLLLHARVIVHSIDSDIDSPAAWHVVVLTSVVTAAAATSLRERHVEHVAQRARQRMASVSCERAFDSILHFQLPPRFLLLRRACSVHRAPPAAHA
ncbi:MAG: hypothetical protein D6744_09795 [Planctomycetota bacterium]|nr:MAG: hypothetical protein D6744_09795 [Planctomycetota bacterium]